MNACIDRWQFQAAVFLLLFFNSIGETDEPGWLVIDYFLY